MEAKLVVENENDYHSNKEILSRSDLQNISVCPAYFKYMLDNPMEKTPALLFGSAFHKLVLEPDKFLESYAIAMQFDRRTKEGKEAYAKFQEENKGKEIVSLPDFETMQQMAHSISENKCSTNILKDTLKESSIYFTERNTDLDFKCRPDAYKIIDREDDKKIICVDLKTCANADLDTIQRETYKRGYDLQAYVYRTGLSALYNVREEDISFIFVFIEKSAPYLVHNVCCSESVFESGKNKFIKYANIYKDCKETNNWYGYAEDTMEDLDIPDYLLNKGE